MVEDNGGLLEQLIEIVERQRDTTLLLLDKLEHLANRVAALEEYRY